MPRRRFFASPASFDSSGNVALSTDEARHLREVLRLSSGDTAFVFDGEGREFECVVKEARRDSARLEIVSEVTPARPESPLQLHLAMALLKGEKFDLVVQKSTELGITSIQPVITKLADIRFKDEADGLRRVTRWERIALEAAKQSGRALVPTILAPAKFIDIVRSDEQSAGMRLMFSERLGGSFEEIETAGSASATALVGSEGGWTDAEIDQARDSGWKIITLGGRTLRAETAAISVIALLQHRLGDLK
jgi:16S rRNA (uracil1498-N3)-methyltransferase